jgi:selenocysteine lyase/cysteine desulfurase
MKGETAEENIDFPAFSAHKMYSPYGGGAVVGLRSALSDHMPAFYGGGIVYLVGDNRVEYKEPPELYEAGSPNYPGVIGMGKAMQILKEVGFDAIQEHEQKLIRRMIDGLKQFENVQIYGDTENISDRVGVVTFNFSDINSYYLAIKLAEMGGVATRRGAFCAHPYVWRLLGIPDEDLDKYAECDASGTPGMIRVSFGIYNTEAEVDEFLRVLAEAIPAAKAHVQQLIEDFGEESQAFNPSF